MVRLWQEIIIVLEIKTLHVLKTHLEIIQSLKTHQETILEIVLEIMLETVILTIITNIVAQKKDLNPFLFNYEDDTHHNHFLVFH